MSTTERPADWDLGGEIVLGSALFTLVDPHKGHEVAYNRWYERDHFYAGCMNGPWFFAGRRWVCTRDLKDVRLGSPEPLFGDDRAGSYLSIYWTPEGRFRDMVDWSTRQVRWLHANGRMFAERTTSTRCCTCTRGGRATRRRRPSWRSTTRSGRWASSWSSRPRAATAATAATAGTRRRGRPPHRRGPPGRCCRPTGRWRWCSASGACPLPDDAPVEQPGTDGADRRELQLWFAQDEPGTWWASVGDYADSLAESGEARVRWASPFIPTVPGTDLYTDQLW